MPISPAEALRLRVAGWRAAEQRERQERREGPILDPEASLLAALELCDLQALDARNEDLVRTREVEQVRRAWAKLRAHHACLPSLPRR